MLSCFLERNCKVYHASRDVDVMNAQKSVELARVADTAIYTDILVLLCYHAHLKSRNIFFKPEPKKATMKWNITAVKEKLGFEIC